MRLSKPATRGPVLMLLLRREAAMIGELNRLKGIGMNDATILVREAFWRDFRNQREVGGWSGMAPSPWARGRRCCGLT